MVQGFKTRSGLKFHAELMEPLFMGERFGAMEFAQLLIEHLIFVRESKATYTGANNPHLRFRTRSHVPVQLMGEKEMTRDDEMAYGD